MNKISGPLLDRIDIQIEVPYVKYNSIIQDKKLETSKEVKNRVNIARSIQKERYKKYNIYSNAEMNAKLIEKYCVLDNQGRQILKLAFEKLKLSVRAYTRILKVARTIADIEQSKNILKNHVAEAIQYRNLDKKYWEN